MTKQRNLFPVAQAEFHSLKNVNHNIELQPGEVATIGHMLAEVTGVIEFAKDNPDAIKVERMSALKAFAKKWKGYEDRKQSLLDDALIAKVASAINSTWAAISPDVVMEGKVYNSDVMEVVLDADRVAEHGGGEGEANEHLKFVYQHHGFDDTVKFLSANISLI